MPKMYHDEIEQIADTSLQAFQSSWAPRGWKLLGEPEAFASEILGKPVKKLDDLKVDELRGLHSARGLDYPAVGKKSDLEKTFRETFAEIDPVADEVETGAPALVNPSGTPTPAADNTKQKD